MAIRVAACQLAVDVDSPDVGAVDAAVREAASTGARLIVLPELAFSGYMFASQEEVRRAAEPLDGPSVTRIMRLSQETGSVIVAGFCEQGDGGAVHNSAMVVQDGEFLGCYRKVHLWDRESELFTPGEGPPLVVDTVVGRLAAMICYDLEMPDWVGTAAAAGADIIAAPCNWPLLDRPVGERPLEVVKAQAAAGTFKVHIVVADRCGQERGVDWIGGSVICEDTGYPAAGPATTDDGPARPAVLAADLEPTSSRNKSLSPRNDVWGDRRPELYWIGCP
ncbi:nitrilase-related carbon-nitrogen hydrolase [Nesterenkonia sp. CL21]|uniref:nitrilase-related carbon-nitrogen hydrolase n=1 Tax=Nesterenkonia sp. CL21 TaxID=3064894 RepID=UPI00287B5023|nr:nitrilase-related carbon-nitrogen hydrolase [Nesterenkonia sp. CL21]MDS2173697.1 nitrilase-related carbon-nitrogen hydrolase [Nesterenkonia sp. CL21]